MKRNTSSMSLVLGHLGLAGRTAVLASVLLLTCIATCPVAYWFSGPAGFIAVIVAMLVCFVGGGASLVLGELLGGPEWMLTNLLSGLFIRMGIPLGFLIVVYARGGMLAEAGVVFYLLLFYPLLLATETVLVVPRIQLAARSPKV